jgi:hypothetical protein
LLHFSSIDTIKNIILGGKALSNFNFAPKSNEEEIMEYSYDRPIGITLLAIWIAIAAVIVLVAQVALFSRLDDVSSIIGVSSYFFQAAVTFLGVLSLATSIGMFLGKKWGWWLALFYFAYEITRNMNAIISIPLLVEQYGDVSSQKVTSYYLKNGVRSAFDSFLIFYLCRESVTSYFRTTETKKWKALLIVFGICIAIILISALLQ